MKDFLYNYVIFGHGGYYKIGYHDLFNLSNVRFFSSYTDGISSKFLRLLIRLTLSTKVNRYFKAPFANIVFPFLYPFKFNDDKPICFITFGCNINLFNTAYLDYLSRKYPKIKHVLYMQDIVEKNSSLDIHKAKKYFDLVLSYDKEDCRKYNLEFYPTPYSKIKVTCNSSYYSDIFYCGYAKNRYDNIMKVYNFCIKNGLKCIFYIVGVPSDLQKKGEGLFYNQLISYEENLKYVQGTKCILEVMQEKAVGFTPRLWESIVFDKHLFTNNGFLKSTSYNHPLSMHYLSEDLEQIKDWINRPVEYTPSLKESFSPINLLKFLDQKLKNL